MTMDNITSRIIGEMQAQRDAVQRANLMRFFKTGKGEYGEGDEFLGLTCPQTRLFVKRYHAEVQLEDVDAFLQSEFHEIRLFGLLVMVEKFQRLMPRSRGLNPLDKMMQRDAIIRKYLDNSTRANNWDLVDMSAPKLLGRWYTLPSAVSGVEKEAIVDSLANSTNLWQRRISMVFTWMTTRDGHPELAIKYALHHIHDPHDLMQKAVGWMLREVGKHASPDLLREFLADHVHELSRTSLRYAIEHFDERERRYWMAQ